MNYDQTFRDLLDTVKNDKGIAQPWRNKVISRLDEAQAILEKGQRMTNLQPPEGWNPLNERVQQAVDSCICPPGAVDKTCPVHGS